jgi:hypothetical protein
MFVRRLRSKLKLIVKGLACAGPGTTQAGIFPDEKLRMSGEKMRGSL